jgi:glutamate synthase (NADPH/NADH)
MGAVDEFDDRQIQIEAENTPYNQYQYNETEQNESWAGALPVKQ